MKLTVDNIFELLPEDMGTEVVESLVQSENVKVERIVSKGHTSPPTGWYDQAQSEWVMVLKGEAIIVVEGGNEIHLIAGSYINIPAHTRHRVKWTKPEIETIWLAVHY